MKRITVKSSNIVSVGYDPDTKTLEVEFQGGRVYQYADVSPDKYSSLMAAHSKGSYVAQNVKNAHKCACIKR